MYLGKEILTDVQNNFIKGVGASWSLWKFHLEFEPKLNNYWVESSTTLELLM